MLHQLSRNCSSVLTFPSSTGDIYILLIQPCTNLAHDEPQPSEVLQIKQCLCLKSSQNSLVTPNLLGPGLCLLTRLCLRRMYPYFVTRDMITDWGSSTTHGQLVDWDTARSLQVNDAHVRQSHHDWGSHGTTTDFGGGGGYSGGGTGGSW